MTLHICDKCGFQFTKSEQQQFEINVRDSSLAYTHYPGYPAETFLFCVNCWKEIKALWANRPLVATVPNPSGENSIHRLREV